MEFHHVSILLEPCLEALQIKPDGVYVDATTGGAGHSLRIAERLHDTGRLICIDRDDEALENAKDRLKNVWQRVTPVKSDFRDIDKVLEGQGLAGADGILFDLGVSSPQLDHAERGFSYMQDAPLDMRMDRQQKLTAYDVVNGWSREEIRRILFEYGEERYAPLIAAAIERERADKPIETTLELVRVIKGAMPAKALREKQHPAKRSFQAIRIAVNDELPCGKRWKKPSTVSIRAADWRSSPSTAWRIASSRRLFSRRHRAAPVRRTFRYASAAKSRRFG